MLQSNDPRIEREADIIVRRQLPYTLGGAVIASFIIGGILLGKIENWIVVSWLAAAWGSCGFGFFLNIKRSYSEVGGAGHNAFLVGSILAGLIWGCAALLGSLSKDPTVMAFLSILIACMATAAVAGIGVHPKNYYGFLLPSLSGMALSFLFYDLPNAWLMVIASLGYMCFLAIFAQNFYRSTIEAIQLRLENEDLLNEVKMQATVAEKANVDKSRFLAAASHDLRQPFHALSLFVTAINEDKLDEETLKIISNIKHSMSGLERMFTELLDISRLDAGAIVPELSHFRIDTLVDNLQQEFLPIAQEKQLNFQVERTDSVIYSDQLLCERIFRNILSNGFSYTQQGGIDVQVFENSSSVQVAISDTGIGIPLEQQNAIYSEFEQLHNPERDRNKGLGLGLAIVKRLSELLELNLELESTLGHGSTFKVILPKGDIALIREITPSEATAFGRDNLRGKTILIIDDDDMARKAIETHLVHWECSGLYAEGINEALQLIESKNVPDLVVCDYRLRGEFNGLEVIENLRAQIKNLIPAIILTGDTDPELFNSLQSSENLRLLHKPIQIAKLRTAINSLL